MLPLAAGAVRAKPSLSRGAKAPLPMLSSSAAGVTAITPSAPDSLRLTLRKATVTDHENVDGEYGRFDLALVASYTKFLIAHARVLGAIEGAVAGVWSPWRARFPLLKADLAELGVAVVEGEPLPTRSIAGQ